MKGYSMKKILSHFVGQGEDIEFRNFTLAHFLPIIIAAAVIFAIYKFRNKIKESKHEQKFALTLAFIAIASEMSYYWRLVAMPSLGPSPLEHLPITICGWVAVFSSFLVLTKNQTLFDIAYFWLLSGSIFAIITPTVISYCGPTRLRYYQFWALHLIGYIIIFYMIFVHKMRPTFKSLIKAYVSFGIFAVIAYFANTMLGTGANYLFMAEPVISVLPTSFVPRLIIMAGVVTLLFFVSYMPWLIIDRKDKKLNTEVEEKEFQYDGV